MKYQWNGLAVDLGASGGRVILGRFDGRRLSLEGVHRFANEPVQLSDTLYWDFLRLFHEVKEGIRRGSKLLKDGRTEPDSIGIDSWGVDFGLLDSAGRLISNPVHYRDRRNEGIIDQVLKEISKKKIYENTGIQFLPFNTIYQIIAVKRQDPSVLDRTGALLMIPDLFHYFFTGVKIAEFTNATTTQLLNPRNRQWSHELLEALGLPEGIFQPTVQPATMLGKMNSAIREELGGINPDIVTVATHDTGSAVASVPALEEPFAYLSCGTWSLVGTEIKTPIVTNEAMRQNFTNEGGVENTFRFLKNTTGLWLLQETQRTWERAGLSISWPEITEMTQRGRAFQCFIDPDAACFLSPGDMPERVRRYCRSTGQTIPENDPDLLRCMTESLALKCRHVFEALQDLTSVRFKALHIVGGGTQNELLCQWIANAHGIPVLAGPREATAIGNLAIQLFAAKKIGSLKELRQMIAESFPPKRYEPTDAASWNDAYQEFSRLSF